MRHARENLEGLVVADFDEEVVVVGLRLLNVE